MYPVWVTVITISSSSIRSSRVISSSVAASSVRRSSPNCDWILSSSSTTICSCSGSLARMPFSFSISFSVSSYSSTIFWRSSPVSRCRRMSRMAWAWTSEKWKRSRSASFASCGVLDWRISATTSSRLSIAILSPSRMWARSSALRSSNWVRRTTTSRRKSTKCRSMSLSGSSCGRPLTSARLITPKVVWSLVYLYSLLRITEPSASRLSSITTRMPSRSDSSRMSLMPSMRLSRTRSAISSISCALFTWYGSSRMMITSRSLRVGCGSMSARPRTRRRPRPVA